MFIEKLKWALVIGSILVISACGYNINSYGVSVANVEKIKSLDIPPVAVSIFTSAKPGVSSIGCRAAGPVGTPNNTSFESYIQQAFIDELRLAGAYDEGSDLVINGHLEEIDFSSNIGSGRWIISLNVSSILNPGFNVKQIYEFSTNFVADKACQQVAQAFVPAVQALISNMVSNPKFQALVEAQQDKK